MPNTTALFGFGAGAVISSIELPPPIGDTINAESGVICVAESDINRRSGGMNAGVMRSFVRQIKRWRTALSQHFNPAVSSEYLAASSMASFKRLKSGDVVHRYG